MGWEPRLLLRWRSLSADPPGVGAIRRGHAPLFDTVYFDITREYVASEAESIRAIKGDAWLAELEATLANLGAQLESPFVRPQEAAKLGTEYERVQKEMDTKLGEWERMQG